MPLQMHGMNSRPLGLSTSQAARELGVSLGTVRRWSDMGYLQSYRTPGGQRRFSVEHIELFVRSLQQNGAVAREQRDERFLHRATG
jgi:excisionase family DNA binding protein